MMTWVEMVVVRRVKAWLHLLRLRIENNDDGDGDDDNGEEDDDDGGECNDNIYM